MTQPNQAPSPSPKPPAEAEWKQPNGPLTIVPTDSGFYEVRQAWRTEWTVHLRTFTTREAAQEFVGQHQPGQPAEPASEATTEPVIGRPDKPFHKPECRCQECLRWIAWMDGDEEDLFAAVSEAAPAKLAKCGHPSYRNHDSLCVNDDCEHAAYRTFAPAPSAAAAPQEGAGNIKIFGYTVEIKPSNAGWYVESKCLDGTKNLWVNKNGLLSMGEPQNVFDSRTGALQFAYEHRDGKDAEEREADKAEISRLRSALSAQSEAEKALAAGKAEIELAKQIHAEYRVLKAGAPDGYCKTMIDVDNKRIAAEQKVTSLQQQLAALTRNIDALVNERTIRDAYTEDIEQQLEEARSK